MTFSFQPILLPTAINRMKNEDVRLQLRLRKEDDSGKGPEIKTRLKAFEDWRKQLRDAANRADAFSTMGSAAPSTTASRTASVAGSTASTTGEASTRPTPTLGTRRRGCATFETPIGTLTLDQMRKAFINIPGVHTQSSSGCMLTAAVNYMCAKLRVNRTGKSEEQKIKEVIDAARERESPIIG